jgi:lipoate-protein ligase A
MEIPDTAWRLLDTGVETAALNMALDSVVLESVSRGEAPPTLRFLQFSPPAALVGVYQRLEEELRLDYCESESIDVNRRLTGGGAIFFDRTQLGWEIVAPSGSVGGLPAVALFRRLSEPVVSALRRLGLDARFRPRNDIEVGGRKISGTGGTAEESAFLFQGTLLTDFDVDTMLRALRVPVEKLKRKEIDSLKERVTCLVSELGECPPLDSLKQLLADEFSASLGVRLSPTGLTTFEEDLLTERLPYFQSESWIRGEGLPASSKDFVRGYARVPSGVLKATVIYNLAREVVECVWFSGDFFAFPRRAVYDLEAALRGVARAELPGAIDRFLGENGVDLAGLGAPELASAVEDAIARTGYSEFGVSVEDANSVFAVAEPLGRVADRGAHVLLLPYCAKPRDCEYRHTEDCSRCGRCPVGDAYALALELGIEVKTILSFEHLMESLSDMKSRGVRAFMGSCCEAFYLKHRDAMEEHGIPGVLVDVESDTCYDLGRAREAYRGAFEGETTLSLDLLKTVVRACAGTTRSVPERDK